MRLLSGADASSERLMVIPHSSRTSEEWARIVASLFVVYGLYYLVWRVGWTLNVEALWLALPLLFAEIFGFLDFPAVLLHHVVGATAGCA